MVRFRVPVQLLLPWPEGAEISVQQAAQMLRCGNTTIIRKIQRGKIAAYQLDPGRAGSPYHVYYDSVIKHLKEIHDKAGLATRFDA
jgi:excisionase family DNA binding protein